MQRGASIPWITKPALFTLTKLRDRTEQTLDNNAIACELMGIMPTILASGIGTFIAYRIAYRKSFQEAKADLVVSRRFNLYDEILSVLMQLRFDKKLAIQTAYINRVIDLRARTSVYASPGVNKQFEHFFQLLKSKYEMYAQKRQAIEDEYIDPDYFVDIDEFGEPITIAHPYTDLDEHLYEKEMHQLTSTPLFSSAEIDSIADNLTKEIRSEYGSYQK